MNTKVIAFNAKQRDKQMPDFRSGDVVKVYRKIKEGEKERIQMFEGMVLGIKGRQSSSPTMTVRKTSFGIGVELIVPLYSPTIEKIELVKRTKTRQAKIYFIRDKAARELKRKLKETAMKADAIVTTVEEKKEELQEVSEQTSQEAPKTEETPEEKK